MSRTSATAIGLAAVAMWSTLGLLTAASGAVPAFLMNALCFGISGIVGVGILAARGGLGRAFRQPWPVWLLGIAGLFGYHALYFTALKTAPPVDASLICYLWPLLIVMLSGLLPGERVLPRHLAGAGLGLVGAVLIVTRQGLPSLSSSYSVGYLAAVAAAFTWAGYSVLSRRFKDVPSDAVVGFCLVTAILSLPFHLAFEESVWPEGAGEWLAVGALGLFPVGLAFFVWDIGVKRGDIQVLGAASYAAPLLSTLLLVAFGYSAFDWRIGVACVLVSAGGLIASGGISGRRERAAAE